MVDGAGVIPTSVQAVPHRGLDRALAKRDRGPQPLYPLVTSVLHLCGAAARDGRQAVGQRVGVQNQPGDPLDDLFELQLSAFCTAACETALPTMKPQPVRDSPSPTTEIKKLLFDTLQTRGVRPPSVVT